MSNLRLQLLESTFAICRLSPDDDWPFKSKPKGFFCLVQTDDEISVVCEDSVCLEAAQVERGWKAFRVAGTLDFSLTGILASITKPLAEAKISIFAVSTFDTDYFLVKADKIPDARNALQKAGFIIE